MNLHFQMTPFFARLLCKIRSFNHSLVEIDSLGIDWTCCWIRTKRINRGAIATCIQDGVNLNTWLWTVFSFKTTHRFNYITITFSAIFHVFVRYLADIKEFVIGLLVTFTYTHSIAMSIFCQVAVSQLKS